jgi:hypothetical protein
MVAGAAGFSQAGIALKPPQPQPPKQDQQLCKAFVQKEKNIKAFASARIRRKRQTQPNMLPLSQCYFDKRSTAAEFLFR